jgi:hypothetical protein
MVGTILMGDDVLLNEMPLCHIRDFDVQSGFRGKVTVAVTLQAVSRVKLVEMTQMKPIMMGLCTELVDDEVTIDLSLANDLVNDIESIIDDLSRVKTSGGINRQSTYKKAYKLALEALTITRGDGRTKNPMDKDERRSLSRLTAASWAVFTIASNKSSLYKAIATTNVVERLQLGLNTLLDEKFQRSADSFNERDENIGFA